MTVNIAASADLLSALKTINAALAPASHEQVEEWLAILSVKTVQRNDSVGRADLTVATYAAHLRQYPADVVRYVLTGWSGKWWPTWGELVERLDEQTDQRLMIRDRLLEILEGRETVAVEADPVSERLAMLREQLAAAERVAEKYPELAESSLRKREAYAEEIATLEQEG